MEKVNFNLYMDKKDKDFIKKRAKELGYRGATSFLLDSSKSFFKLNVDMSVYRKLVREVNYIGKNINSIIRRINTEKIYSDLDVEHLERRLDEVYNLIEKEYDKLEKLAFEFTSNDLSKDESARIIEAYRDNNLEIPKYILLENTYQNIHDSIVFISELVHESKYQDEAVEEYLWNYLYGKTLTSLSDEKLISFSNEIFKFYQVLRIKKEKLDYHFTDDDWFNLLDILDKYEVS